MILDKYIMPVIYLFVDMAPYLLLGLMIAGVLHAFVPQTFYRKHLSENDFKSVILSIIIGIPLPLCSCGVIPTTIAMRKEGVSKGAATAFLITTPQTGVDSIAATWSVLGLPFAMLRVFIAIVSGLIGGVVVNHMDREDKQVYKNVCMQSDARESQVTLFMEKCRNAIRYGFSEMLQDIGFWLVIGLVLAGLITIFVPEDFFVSYRGNSMINMLLVLIIAAPMYVCATGSIPIAAALMLKGLSPGAALVFLVAGPAANIASMTILGKTMGSRTLMVYIGTIVLCSMGVGLLVDAFLPQEWFKNIAIGAFGSCNHEAITIPWWKVGSAIILGILLLNAMIFRFSKKKINISDMRIFKIKGMTCNKCCAHVYKSIEAIEGVDVVDVNLARGIASVKGSASSESIIKAVEEAGYGCSIVND